MRNLKLKIKNFKFYNVILIFTFCILNLLMGCATYKFQRGNVPYDKGYVISRDGYTILEYTIGEDNSVPRLKLAKERLKRRQKIVEHYYKKMGYVENHLKMTFWDPAVFLLKMIGGVFRLPFVAISDYRYEHNPKYRERIKNLEEEKEVREEARIQKLKEELNVYIQKDLAAEKSTTKQSVKLPEEKEKPSEELISKIEPQPPEEMPKAEKVTTLVTPKKEQPKRRIVEKKQPKAVARAKISGELTAIIIAKPLKGYSPLKVHFYGSKSYSPKAKIVSYAWDFGDGDTSTKINSINTYWSKSFTPQYFTATLTVQDDKGNTAQASTAIEVLSR